MLEVAAVTTLGDYFVIAAGSSAIQVKALADYVELELKEQGITPERVEGYRSTGWILIDYGAVIVHIFKTETRDFYNLERLWQDGKRVDIQEFVEDM